MKTSDDKKETDAGESPLEHAAATASESRRRALDTMWFGFGALFVLDVVVGLPGSLVVDRVFGGYATLTYMLLFGIWHALWGLPLAGWFKLQRMHRAMRGVLVTLGITFLLTSACWGLMTLS
ncbi:MAG TPA: hypothetical protein VK843_20060 [Planctomycetota bacterium]|nr:hypothetical protein [Planctomycetota bacterium]